MELLITLVITAGLGYFAWRVYNTKKLVSSEVKKEAEPATVAGISAIETVKTEEPKPVVVEETKPVVVEEPKAVATPKVVKPVKKTTAPKAKTSSKTTKAKKPKV